MIIFPINCFFRAISADSSRTDAASDTEEKLSPFRDRVQTVVSSLVDDSLSTEPDQGKGRKKTVQVRIERQYNKMRNIQIYVILLTY